jgi:tRNA threonylcarbamoyladenosine biosynthesis protein TsaB
VAEPRLLVLETSGRVGQVALAEGETVRCVRRLDEARRHARDLAPALAESLAELRWQVGELHAVIVSRGPGSYTGLRVGIMSAKTLAYATGCALIAVDTFTAIALQAPAEALRLDVLADAQQDRIYVQRFSRPDAGADWQPVSPLAIESIADWLAHLHGEWITGPGLHGHESRLPAGVRAVPVEQRDPQPLSLLRLGLARYLAGERDDYWTLEPLYLRPSSAEEKWQARSPSR